MRVLAHINSRSTHPAVALSWLDVEHAVCLLSTILGKGEYLSSEPTVVALARGGAVPAVMICHRLGIRNAVFMGVGRTGSDRPRDYAGVRVTSIPKLSIGEQLLIIEDIVFDGISSRTAAQIAKRRKAVPRAICCLVASEDNTGQIPMHIDGIPIHAAYTCSRDTWIRFPWERSISDEVTLHECATDRH